jgi:hypothetical protein
MRIKLRDDPIGWKDYQGPENMAGERRRGMELAASFLLI